MAQVKIYGLKEHLGANRAAVSDAVHTAVMAALHYPEEKKFHRFIPLSPDDFIFPADRSSAYTLIEISLFEGRSADAKKELIRLLFKELEAKAGITGQDVEITLFETPKANWGIRGVPADELSLNYNVNV